MNRVYPLREGSGECYALARFDAGPSPEFRRRPEKISFQIIRLRKRLWHLRHRLRLWLCRITAHRAGRGGWWSEVQKHRQRCDLGAARIGDVEVLVLQSRTDHADVRLTPDAPREFRPVGRKTPRRHQRVDVAVELPACKASL